MKNKNIFAYGTVIILFKNKMFVVWRESSHPLWEVMLDSLIPQQIYIFF